MITIKLLEITAMSIIPELTRSKTHKVTTVRNDKCEFGTKVHFLEQMTSTDWEEHEQAKYICIQLLHGVDE